MFPNYNPSYPYGMQNLYGMPNYQQALQQPVQPTQQTQSQSIQAQTIQKVNQPAEEQAVCYFVQSPEEITAVKVAPFTYYLGINEQNKEIYVRKMKSDGTVGTDTYVLAAEKQEKTDMQIISERLDSIEQKLNTQIVPDFLKGKDNGSE